MSFVSLDSAIQSKLAGISAIQAVYNYHAQHFSGFPAATFEPSGHGNEFYTNTDNFRSYSFDIILHVEMPQGGRRNAIAVLETVVDAVVTAFDSDYTLGGVCDFAIPLPSSWGEYTSGSATVKYATLTLVLKKEVAV